MAADFDWTTSAFAKRWIGSLVTRTDAFAKDEEFYKQWTWACDNSHNNAFPSDWRQNYMLDYVFVVGEEETDVKERRIVKPRLDGEKCFTYGTSSELLMGFDPEAAQFCAEKEVCFSDYSDHWPVSTTFVKCY
jgi:hypothetical protein